MTVVLEIPLLLPPLELDPPFVTTVLVATDKPPGDWPFLIDVCKLFYWSIAAWEPGVKVVLTMALKTIDE